MWSSPTFLKRGRFSSASYLNSIFDPFLEEDGYLEGISRKRTKLGRESGQWRYTERSPSPDRESEAELQEASQHGPLGPADEETEKPTVLEESRDLQESEKQERDTKSSHENSLLIPFEGRTSDIRMTDSAVTGEEEPSIVAISENHSVEAPVVSVGQHELSTGLPGTQRSLSVERSPVVRENLLTAEGAEDVVAGGPLHIIVEPSLLSQVDTFPDGHMHLDGAQHASREEAPLSSQLKSPFSPGSPLLSPALVQAGNASPYVRLDGQREYHKVGDNASNDEHMNTAAEVEESSLSAQDIQQEVVNLGIGIDTLNAKEMVSGVLPGDTPIRQFSDLATMDTSFGLDGGAFSQPTTDDVSSKDRWEHVAAAHKGLENPRGVSETSSSPLSHLSDTSPIEIGGDVAELLTPSDGLGRIVPASQDRGAVTADNDVNEFVESSALDIKSERNHDPSSPQSSHAIDVDGSHLSSHGSEDEEDEEECDSEDERVERWHDDENSEDWTEGSEDDSIRLEEYSSFGSDEPEVEGQVPLVKPPIEVINLEDDDDEVESVQDGFEGPYDVSVPYIPSTNLISSGDSRMLEVDDSHDQDILSEDSELSRILEAAEDLDEDAQSADSEFSRPWEVNEDRGEDVLSEDGEPAQLSEVDEVHGRDILSIDGESAQMLEGDEDRGEDVLSRDSEPSQRLEADEAPEEDVLSVDSEPSQLLEVDEDRGEDVLARDSEPSQRLEADEAHDEDGLPVDIEPSQVLEVYEARDEDVLLVDSDPEQRRSFQAHELAIGITSLGQGVPFPETDTAGHRVHLLEHHTVNSLVREPNGENYQEVKVEIKQAIDSPLPDPDLTSRGHKLIQESEVRHDISGPRLRNQFLTPDATQGIHVISPPLSFVSLPSLNGSQDLLTPRPTESNSTDPLQLDAPLHQPRSSLLEKLKELRTSSAKRSQVRSESEDPSVISPWFAPKRSSQVALKSVSDAESEHSDVESDIESALSKNSEEDVDDQKEIPTRYVSKPTQPLLPPTGLRTSLSYFAPLASLESHFRSKLDVMAMVIMSTGISRTESGPRDYLVTIHLADPSTTTSSNVHTTAVSIFRPIEQALPLAQSGDAVLLRDFNVQRRKRRFSLLSTNSSAWAVFRTGEEAQIRGPPVEFGAAERGFVRGLRDWWESLAAEVKEKLRKEVLKEKELDEGKGRWVDGKHVLRDGTTYTDVPAEERNAIHELRDGTTYVDEDL